jgi:hypothetical protein
MAAKKKAQPQDEPAAAPRERLEALRDAVLAAHRKAPAKDQKQSALQDGWVSILKPRVQGWIDRLEDFLAAKRWEFDDEEDVGVALFPSHLDHVVRDDVVYVFAGLAGALRQYHTIRLVWRAKVRFGFTQGKNAPIGSKKAIDDQNKKAQEELKKAEDEQQKAYRETMQKVLDGWAETRKLLAGHLDELQALMDELLRIEEARLEARLDRAPQPKQEKAAPHLQEAKTLRRDAKSFATDDGSQASEYTGLLRKWLGARRRAAQALV